MPATHPDRLAVLATLFGMAPAPPEACRVLELGCGDGGNLIPMALGLPESRFVGIDTSELAIRTAGETASALGLGNVSFRRLDLRGLTREFGEFDYIVAHGVYSWAPEDVRERILAICGGNLAPQGVAYVSYNTNPGGHLRTMVREMMLFHTEGTADPERQVAEARGLLGAIFASLAVGEPYRDFVRAELERLSERGDSYLYHDELSPVYRPLLFSEFIAAAGRHGLQFLAEADLHQMQLPPLPQAAAAMMRSLSGDVVRRQQYLDFFRLRCFRKTLLCRSGIPLDHNARLERIRGFHVGSTAKPAPPKPGLPPSAEEFRTPAGLSMAAIDPEVKSVLHMLARVWPGYVRPAALPEANEDMLLALYARGMVDFRLSPPRWAAEPGERPLASPLARLQVRDSGDVTTLRHTVARLEGPCERLLLALLDGGRDRAALAAELSAFFKAGISAQQVDENVAKLARLTLLLRR